MMMNSKIAILAATVACLTQGADLVRAQQPYPSGGYPYAVPATPPGMAPGPGYRMAAPAQYAPTVPQPGTLPTRYHYPGSVMTPGSMPTGGTPGSAHSGMPVRVAQGPSAVPYPSGPMTSPAPGPMTNPSIMAEGSSVMPGKQPMQAIPGALEPTPSTIDSSSTDMGPWQGACTGSDGCNSCDSCESCGHPDCACGCGSLFGGRLGCLFGSGGGWSQLGQLHHQWANSARPVRFWGGVEGLWWWNKERELPVLATTSVAGTPFADAGVLGEPGTSILFGGGEFDGEGSEGIRGTLGYWVDPGQNIGILARAFQFGEEEIDFRASSTGDPILARPFFDVGLGLQDALVVAYPGITRGWIDIQTSNEVRGYDLMLRRLLYYGECNRLDLIGGYHGTKIEDGVQVAHQIVSTDPAGLIPVGTRINTVDSFEAENEFHGGSIGIMAQGFDGRLTWNFLSKISFGSSRETMSIRGTSTTFVPGAGVATFDQGLLALDSNSGIYERDQFAFVPELDLSVMYNVCSMLSVSVGYSAIYWSDVLLATDAVNTSINPTQIDGPLIGPPRPLYSLVDDDFWLHGLTFGIHGRY
jgi:hypothetical protein